MSLRENLFYPIALILGSCLCAFAQQQDIEQALAIHTSSSQQTVNLTPGEDVQTVVNQNPAGTRYLFSPGTYRLQQIHPHNGDQYIAMNSVILSGASLLQNFQRSGNYWMVTNQTQEGQTNGSCLSSHPMCIYPEDLFFDNKPLLRVASLSQVVPGSWFFDYTAHAIYFVDNPQGHKVETSVARSAFSGMANNVMIVNFIIEKYAIPAQMGAIGDQYSGTGWTVARNEVRLNHGTGIQGQSNWYMVNNYVHDNGQKGVGGVGNSIRVETNEISFNNFAGYDAAWEAGGSKFAMTTNLTVQSNRVHDNAGPGLWTDIDNVNTLYDSNTCYNNAGPGIQHEISWAATISNNNVYNNGSNVPVWLWDSQILIENSSNVQVFGNTVNVAAAYGNGIGIIYQNRGSGPLGVHLSANNYIHDNNITYQPGPNSWGASGMVVDYQPTLAMTFNNKFDSNHYHLSDATRNQWKWESNQNWFGFLGDSQEAHGTVDSVIVAAGN